ncbi:hypothetical protein PGT21_009521 [Puccinia graminis f. sp. tritici]|uniref:Uncharacterized protein n=1 Tax=Puccinia graminis f. sp. tritici TaxID=56615 RepID=A0A5B0NIR1_PUCGR|nr:hypothetical protein PGTUg99_031857 [Puccinia graminis f. sp. tritici]KAA1105511.1 hypothetical protein PGT21_009521 [Puccinia graminis f. sp. tritici]
MKISARLVAIIGLTVLASVVFGSTVDDPAAFSKVWDSKDLEEVQSEPREVEGGNRLLFAEPDPDRKQMVLQDSPDSITESNPAMVSFPIYWIPISQFKKASQRILQGKCALMDPM